MKQHLHKIHHHVKKAHEHLKRHGKWYIYGHILAASMVFSFVLNSQSRSDASVDNSLCIQALDATNIVLEYDYKEPKKDVILKGISFDNVVFPELVRVSAMKQIIPTPNNNEISTDRGDLASYNYPNKENPTETEIVDYLSNNNLNNFIDGEGFKEVKLDIEFEKVLYDNASTEDVVGELLIFERGMNADIYIQALDGLAGNQLGKKIFLNRKDLIYAGFDIDTVEIGAAQKVGYWRVDLNKLEIGTVKYIRISSLPTNSGPDLKIIGLNTKKCQPKQLKPMNIESVCSLSPMNKRYWKIINPNDQEISFTWDIYRSTQTGASVIAENSEVIVQANTIEGPTVLRVYSDGEIQNIVPSTEEKCPIIQPEIPLELKPICSSDPENYRVWKVINNNSQDLEFSWEVKNTLSCNGNKVLVCQVPQGNPENEHEICVAQQAVAAHLAKDSYLGACINNKEQGISIVTSLDTVIFTTPVIDESQLVSISIDGLEHDTAATISTSCPKQPVNDYTISVTTDKTEVIPYQELIYGVQYGNVGPEIMQSGSIEIFVDENFQYTPGENVEIIEPNHYKFTLPTMSADSSNILEITGTIKGDTVFGSSISFKAIVSGERDVNNHNNIAVVNTLVKGLESLELSSLCSDNPSSVRAWRIQNSNTIDIPVDIYIQDEFSASVVAKANELTYIKTNTTEGINTISLRYNGEKQMEQSSENVACPRAISDLAVKNIDVEMLSEETFVAQITFINFGPNVSNEIVIDVGGEDASFVVDKTLQPQIQQTVQEMGIDEEFILSVTGSLASGEAQVAVTIDGQTIDPNIYNNNSQQTISSSSYSAPLIEDETIEEGDEDVHNAPDQNPEEIQGYELGEKVDLEEHMQENQDMENMIGLGCSYQDVDYENIIFQDVKNHRSKPYVELLRVNCIVRGREANTFVTEDSIKRAEAIKVAIKLWGMKNDFKIKSENYIYLGDTPMSDINNAHRSAQYVDQAYQIGLLDSLYKGNSSKKISPDQSITRGEAVELLVKTYLLLEKSGLGESETMITAIFADIDSKASYTPYIQYAYERGFLQGVVDEGKQVFLPNQKISRSEFAKIAALIFKDFLSVYRIK